MTKPVQQRTLKTRAKLIAAAEVLIAKEGYTALRVEDVVQKAGVAKGTFFAHFRDKDALMDRLIGAHIDRILDDWEKAPAPKTIPEVVAIMSPLLTFLTSERYVFDVVMRYSGATLIEDIGPIAMTIGRFDELMCGWMEVGEYRADVSPQLLSEGVQAFFFQAMALHFCALHSDIALTDRLQSYLSAWLIVKTESPSASCT